MTTSSSECIEYLNNVPIVPVHCCQIGMAIVIIEYPVFRIWIGDPGPHGYFRSSVKENIFPLGLKKNIID